MPTLFFAQTITLSGLRPNCVGSTERFAEAPPTRLRNLLADSSEAGRFARCGFHACRPFARYHIRVRISDMHLVAGLGGFKRAVDKLVRLQKAKLDLHPVSEIGPTTTGFKTTLSSPSSAATSIPLAPKKSAVSGTESVSGSAGMWK